MSVDRNRGLPALDTPCSRSTDPLRQGVGASPAKEAIWRRLSKCRNSPSDQRMAANSGPMPLMLSNIAAGAGVVTCCEQRVPLSLHRLDLLAAVLSGCAVPPPEWVVAPAPKNFGWNND